MRTFTSDDDLRGAEFDRLDLSGARFRDVSLAGAQVRGADLSDVDLEGMITGLRIYGVEVQPLITAELDRRHPERALLSATEPDALGAGWAEFEAMWAATVERVRGMPPGTEDESVDREWSFKQTLRHLIMATDAWLNLSILRKDKPFHPLGLLFWEAAGRTEELGLVPADAALSFDEVLAARDERVGMVRDHLAEITTDHLDATCGCYPWDNSPDAKPLTVRHCLSVIFNEEWEHHRFATRDLEVIAQRGTH